MVMDNSHGGFEAEKRPPIVIVGLGLIGGSMARDLAALGHEVHALDLDRDALEAAHAAGVICCPPRERAHFIWPRGAWVVLAMPVDAQVEFLERHRDHLNEAAFLTDVGSTKSAVIETAERLGLGERFVGGHPLAGDHRSGWHASRRGLFEGSRVFLSPTTDSTAMARERAVELWTSLGARTEFVTAATHDHQLSLTSHLPQFLSTALAVLLAEASISRDELGPGGLGMTRLAESSPSMWTAIGRQNAVHLAAALQAIEVQLQRLRSQLEEPNAAALRQTLDTGNAWANQRDP